MDFKYITASEIPNDLSNLSIMKSNTLLYIKMKTEYDEFINNLKNLPPEKIIESSYEKVFKEEILNCFQSGTPLNKKQAKAIFFKKYPLDYLYQEWRDTDSSYLDMLIDSIKNAADKEIKYGKHHNLSEKETR